MKDNRGREGEAYKLSSPEKGGLIRQEGVGLILEGGLNRGFMVGITS